MGQGSSSTSCPSSPFRCCEGSKKKKRLKKHNRAERVSSRCTSASDVLEASDSSDHEAPGSSAGTAKHKQEAEPHVVSQSSEEVIELTLKSDEEPKRAEREVSWFSTADRQRKVVVRGHRHDYSGLCEEYGQLSLHATETRRDPILPNQISGFYRALSSKRSSHSTLFESSLYRERCSIHPATPSSSTHSNISSLAAPPCPKSVNKEKQEDPEAQSQTCLMFPATPSSSFHCSVLLLADYCLESEEKQEDPEVQSLYEIWEPATRYGVFSPLEADSHLQSSIRDSSDRKKVSRSSSFPSSPKTSANSKSLKRAASLPDMKLKSSFEEFSPDCTDEFDGETYRFQCSCPGLYQCRETGLVFDMKEGGQVLYRILTWNRRQLSPHHKKPAGPLFDIKCLKEGSMSQLHLPHCEIFSTGGCGFLSVAHVKDDGIEFIRPEKITETHVIIKVTGFSGFGNVKDEDSPSVPIRALVLLFYKPPLDHKLKYIISVLLLPKNVVLKSVLHFRKKVCQNEMYIETPQYCKLCPDQLYSLTTRPGGDSVRVQPSNAEFDEDHNENYVPTFQVIYETMMDDIELFLKDSSSTSVWESLVCLPPSRPTRPDLSSNQQLKDICSSFIDRISGPVLQSLLDKLLEKHVINDGERESAEEKRNRGKRARVVLDMVRRKGDAASSEMMEILCELDPFLCKDLGLI